MCIKYIEYYYIAENFYYKAIKYVFFITETIKVYWEKGLSLLWLVSFAIYGFLKL